MKNIFKNIRLKPKQNNDINYDDELVNNLNISQKSKLKIFIPLALLIFIFGLTGAILFYSNFFNNEDITNTNKKNTNIVSKNTKQNLKENDNLIDLTSIENPFVNKESPIYLVNNQDTKVNKNHDTNNVPAIPNYNNNNLPVIPSFNQNNLPQMPIVNNTQVSQIQGISSNENGENIAIVNGQVVQEGDTFNGNTISKINNNGITFSNGNQISYNIAQ